MHQLLPRFVSHLLKVPRHALRVARSASRRRVVLVPRCRRAWIAATLLLLVCRHPISAQDTEAVEFNRDIRPILSGTCFACHGPDKTKRKGDLRLDTQAGAYADRGDYRIIAPGKPDQSELFSRITADDDTQRMPPADSGKQLSAAQIALVGRWIKQGAQWQDHWAFIAPQRPPYPPVKLAYWPRNGIDYFVLARLEREGLRPSPEADKTTLLRRVTLDLTGLPPTPAEVDAFLLDNSPEAYEKVVDRLLESPRYGERMAIRWLDAARYADTSGYQNDGPRYMWRWRDWVINAYNRNLPFDQFTIEQLAGDLLPGATLEQVIATGFNRNHRGNAEGGIIPEEFAVEYVVDRVETTSTVWMGLTMGCGRCHEHKFDPISQEEFYQVFAYFNNVPEYGRAIKEGNSPPYIKAPTPRQQQQLSDLQSARAAAERHFADLSPQLEAAQPQWERDAKSAESEVWSVAEGLVAHYRFNGDASNALAASEPGKFLDGEAAFSAGRLDAAGEFDGRRYVEAGDAGNFGYFDKFSLSAWIRPKGEHGGTIVSRMADVERGDGYYVQLVDGKVQVNLVKRWLDDSIRVETQRALEPDQWHHVAVTYDGSRVTKGITVYVNGNAEPMNVHLDGINQSFTSTEPLRIGGGGGPDGRFNGLIDDVRVYTRCLSADEAAIVATPERIDTIVRIPVEGRTTGQTRKLRAYYLEQHAPDAIARAYRRMVSLREEEARYKESIPTVMVMQDMDPPRETFVLRRGEYDKPGEKVTPGVPACLPPLPEDAPNNRLGFARWLVDPAHPLTARVAVNRYWQGYFGIGLVKTAEDFGTQGRPPSHPLLLDWLATEFIGSGWDVKAMQKTTVMSATYRQSSKVTPALAARDPENGLLARGPRFRLSAEMIRDQALAVSGLLVERLGGPSVLPYQPAGLWKEIATDTEYNQSHGDDLYRRSLYTYWKRTVAAPTMMTFDAAGRETCIVLQTRTNTPLQALTLMNDVTFVEAARVLAQRVMLQGGATPAARLSYAFRRAAARPPRGKELAILTNAFKNHWSNYQSDRAAAEALVQTGESPRDESLDVAELAAYTTVASMILNLDEVITKQ